MRFADSLADTVPADVKTFLHYLRYLRSDGSALKTATGWRHPSGYERIYLYHIRKTAGSSLRWTFMDLGGQDLRGGEKERHLNTHGWVVHGGYAYVTHNRYLLERSSYFFGDSHFPFHDVRIPEKTFTITILRDPVARVISHYRMLLHWQKADIDHPARRAEASFLGDSFSDFLERLPRTHLMRQLYMFSPRFDVDEAIRNLAKVNFIMLTEQYNEHLGELAKVLNLDLKPLAEKAGYGSVPLSDEDRARLREVLAPEYALMQAALPLAGIHRVTR
ncbi:MAG: sulfotransferase family 2 domain-containing protein [Rhodospirillales bacterium]|nr:sulfotransferase family 2 domain-containing protein [Rhodospirillales bacterium]